MAVVACVVMLPEVWARREASDAAVRARTRDALMRVFIPDEVCMVSVVLEMVSEKEYWCE